MSKLEGFSQKLELNKIAWPKIAFLEQKLITRAADHQFKENERKILFYMSAVRPSTKLGQHSLRPSMKCSRMSVK